MPKKYLWLSALVVGVLCLPVATLAYAPSYVNDLEVSSTTAVQMTITWTAPDMYEEDPAIDSYDVELAVDEDFTDPVSQSVSADTLTATFSGLRSNLTYYYRARANNADGEGEWYESYDSTAPTKVKHVRKTKQSVEEDWVIVRWNMPTRCNDSACYYNYKIYKNNGDVYENSYTYDNHLLIYDLAQGKRYRVKVQACNGLFERCGKWSQVIPFKLK